MAEYEEYLNEDADRDSGDEEKEAKALWVRVANSTKYAMKVETFIERAKRQDVQGVKGGAGLKVAIPAVVGITPKLEMETQSVPLVYNTPRPNGPDPTVSQLAPYTCEKILENADTDLNSEWMSLTITKMDAGGPQFPGGEGSSWTAKTKHKHGVIIIVHPNEADQLHVIPAKGQFFASTPWMPHPKYCRMPNLRKTYDPMMD